MASVSQCLDFVVCFVCFEFFCLLLGGGWSGVEVGNGLFFLVWSVVVFVVVFLLFFTGFFGVLFL